MWRMAKLLSEAFVDQLWRVLTGYFVDDLYSSSEMYRLSLTCLAHCEDTTTGMRWETSLLTTVTRRQSTTTSSAFCRTRP